MRASHLTIVAALLGALATPDRSAAQFPAELSGRVIETGSALPLDGALVEIDGGTRAFTDGAGAFLLRSATAGSVRVRVALVGYAPLDTTLALESGRTVAVTLALSVAPVEIEGIAVRARADDAGAILFTREAIVASGALTLDELLAAVPGAVVRADGGGAQRLSIRGSSADEVLVLVDGAPINDALTGEADLSRVPLQGVESVEVVTGARSAQHGARALGGVGLVRTGAHRPGFATSARAGSLGSAAVQADASARVHAATVEAGARFTRANGEFRFDRPDALGGGEAERSNADEREIGGFGGLGVGPLRLRVEHARLERGLPGPVHATTPEARHDATRTIATASVLTGAAPIAARVDAHAGWHDLRYEDPAPAFGAAYFDTTRARELGVRAEAEHATGAGLRREMGAGLELRHLRLESTTLDRDVVERTDRGVFARGALELAKIALSPRLSVAARADRWRSDWIASHEVALRLSLRALVIDAAQRSAFTPPSPSDQFFASGVGIEPNPDLEPERVRSELELGVSTTLDVARIPIALGTSVYRSDVSGMIVWAPDHRFVWSPHNRDVKRRGGEAWLRTTLARDVEAGGWLSVARVTYDWPGDADSVQVVYRPRYSGGATFDWNPGAWRVGARALYTGVRYATPGLSNPLPGYWDVRLALSREWRRGPALLVASLRVERLLDNTDSFIHGYPEAGRRLFIELGVRPAERSFTTNTASIQ